MQWIFVTIIAFVLAVFVGTQTSVPETEEILTTNPSADESVETQVEGSPETSATRLDLSGQGLTQVPASVFSSADITYLDLSNNQLTGALQAEVRHLSTLKVLDLSNNAFTGVPAEVGQLQQLEELYLNNNQLTGLPHELGNLQNLKRLDLRGNTPSAFDVEIISEALPNTEIVLE